MQDGSMGQTDTCKMNGECRKRKPNPGHFWQFKNPALDAFVLCLKKRIYDHPTVELLWFGIFTVR